MKFKNGDHVRISAKCPQYCELEIGKVGIILEDRIQSSLYLKLINGICFNTLYIQDIHLEYVTKKGEQLEFAFMKETV